MADQSRSDDQSIPNQAAKREKAEGSRENAADGSDRASGISNRPLPEEESRQNLVPPRGDRKEGGHA